MEVQQTKFEAKIVSHWKCKATRERANDHRCKTSGGKVSVRPFQSCPLIKVLKVSSLLWPATIPEEVKFKLLPEPLNRRTKENHMCLIQNFTQTKGAQLLPSIEKACKPGVSVAKSCIRQPKLSNGYQLGMLKHICLPRILCQWAHVRQMICPWQRPLKKM